MTASHSDRTLSRGIASLGSSANGVRVLALILAGGKGSRLGALTRRRAKPVVPFAGTYRLVDFALSSVAHSGITDVWVVEEYRLHSLNDHLGGGRPWDLDRTRGGLTVLPPYSSGNDDEGGFASGNADALYRHLSLLREYAPEVLLVLSADHIHTIDLAPVVRRHRETGAGVTMVTVTLPEGEDATRFAGVTADDEGRVTRFAYKPDEPISDEIATEIFAYDAPKLFDRLERLASEGGHDGLGDYGERLVPSFVDEGEAYALHVGDYWRDVGLYEAYWQAHMDLVHERGVTLDDPHRPVLSSSVPRTPARVERGGAVEDALVAYGARVAGTVRRSVLGPGAVVEAGATVEDSVLARDVHVRAGATVRRAILDDTVEIGADATVGGADGDLTVVGSGAKVEAGATVPPGAEVERPD
jgi:glucose-1-phosphate adenylyltransferase